MPAMNKLPLNDVTAPAFNVWMVVCLILNANNCEKKQMPLNSPFADFLISFYSFLRCCSYCGKISHDLNTILCVFTYFTIDDDLQYFQALLSHSRKKTWVDDIIFAIERFRIVWIGYRFYSKKLLSRNIQSSFNFVSYAQLWVTIVKYMYKWVMCSVQINSHHRSHLILTN